MHHLILVREIDQQMSGSGCCGRVEGDLTGWVGGKTRCFFPRRREMMDRFGALYRRVREEFGEQVRITVIDPRNQISFLPLVLRDAVRYRVPPLTALRTAVSASVCSGVFDGRILFRGEVPTPQEVVDRIRGRMRDHAVGAPPPEAGEAHV
jgi:hypothetical protein